MLYPFGDNEHFAWAKRNVSFAHLDCDLAFEYQEEVVSVVVFVPDELSLDFDDDEVVAIELAHSPWLPVLSECGELLSEVNRIQPRRLPLF